MEALNVAGLTPLSVLCDIRTEPRKVQSLPTVCLPKLSASASLTTNKPTLGQCLTRSVTGGLVLLSSVFGPGLAKALTYEEALQQLPSDIDGNGVFDGILSLASENPVIIGGGLIVLAVPLILSQVLSKPKAWGVESAKSAYAKLGENESAQLLDIRAPAEIRQVGSPDVRGFGKKPVSIVYKGEDKPGFLKKLALKFKEPANTTLFILDK